MTVSNEIFLITVILTIVYVFMYKEHPFIASIFTVLLGAATLLFITTNNLMGILIIMMGIVTFLMSPWDEEAGIHK